MVKLSIIIPIYNVEDCISRCFQSIYEYGISEKLLEVIAINDGTKDNSMAIVRQYALLHSNIRIIDKENEGVSITRNKGIGMACGDFITFVDADDRIDSRSLNELLEFIENNAEFDILIARSFNDKGKESYPWIGKCKSKIAYTGIEVSRMGCGRGCVWGGIYRRRFLIDNRLNFLSIRNAEDTIFYCECAIYAQRVFFYDVPFYYVTLREGSASRDYDKTRLQDYAKGLFYVENIKATRSLEKKQLVLLDNLQYTLISNVTYKGLVYGVTYKELASIVAKYCRFKKPKTLKMWILNFSYYLFYKLSLFKYVLS